MAEECEKENVSPLRNKRKLSLSTKKNQKRFSETTFEEVEEMAKRKVPKNTEKTSKWAITNLKEWFDDYNTRNPEKKCPGDFLTADCPKEIICKWLRVYVNETRTKNGSPYPPKTLQCLLSRILRHMREKNPNYPNFLAKEDGDFSSFHVQFCSLIILYNNHCNHHLFYPHFTCWFLINYLHP